MPRVSLLDPSTVTFCWTPLKHHLARRLGSPALKDFSPTASESVHHASFAAACKHALQCFVRSNECPLSTMHGLSLTCRRDGIKYVDYVSACFNSSTLSIDDCAFTKSCDLALPHAHGCLCHFCQQGTAFATWY